MTEQLAEGDIGVADDEIKPICPECGKQFKNAKSLQSHLWSYHNEERPPREPRRRSSVGSHRAGSGELNRLRRELKKSVSALTLIPFMAKGTADRLTDPRITTLIDEKAQGFADAWVAVAEQNEYVKKNLAVLLSGGVWLNAAAQTLALGYVVAVFSGVTPMHPGALMLLPEMGQFVYQQPAAPAAGANGSPTTDATEATS